MNFEVLFTTEGLVSLLTLTALEIVLGIDNIIFISILADRLPREEQKKARSTGIILALFVRIALLFGISWLVSLKDPIITLVGHGFSGRDLILLSGGLFLLYKSTTEIHEKLEGEEETVSDSKRRLSLASAIVQIVLIDIVFSFDSILTAVGLVDQVIIMVTAVVIALIIMLIFSGAIADFVNKRPTIKMLALSFLVMIGVLLVAESFGAHVPKGYVYFSMAFALGVEILNLRMAKKSGRPVRLHSPYRQTAQEEEDSREIPKKGKDPIEAK
ncbi:TerC family protein [Cytophagaceae bacterium YF14B1]|uniref:TerC family protein n=1 Tax=Xanthocytophaga flava TaxID=3048013 RepID=A0AAE3QX18_9BACT|nr:TerC family protein [Xanthocytophaga flavus]MDJ1484810.1 TerC family protein [Xanthocytophaga flavus]